MVPSAPILFPNNLNVVSVYMKKEKLLRWKQHRKKFTVLSSKTSTRYWIPLGPMSFWPILIAFNVYKKKSKDKDRRNEEKRKFTVLSRKRLATYLTPSSPIWVTAISKSVSVWMRNNAKYKKKDKYKRDLLKYFLRRPLDAWLLQVQFHYLQLLM